MASGGYEPLEAGPSGCAFLRGGEVLVAVSLPRVGAAAPELTQAPGGRWRDVLSGEERTFGSREPLERVLGSFGLGVFERIGSRA
jgi:hypothetical protein